VRVDVVANQIDGELELPESTVALCMTPDGSSLFAASSTPARTLNATGPEGLVLEIDPKTLAVQRTIRVPIDPFDIQVSDKRLAFISSGDKRLSLGVIAVVDMNDTQAVVARWPDVHTRSRIRLCPDQRHLVFSENLIPPSVVSWRLPANPSEVPTVRERLSELPGIPLGGNLFLTPRGDYLLTSRGGVVPVRMSGGLP
jgi:hypothetical protein